MNASIQIINISEDCVKSPHLVLRQWSETLHNSLIKGDNNGYNENLS